MIETKTPVLKKVIFSCAETMTKKIGIIKKTNYLICLKVTTAMGIKKNVQYRKDNNECLEKKCTLNGVVGWVMSRAPWRGNHPEIWRLLVTW